ncbi:MAG: hypothetical protein EA403_09020 [Spirochaetaceae bacterium]|nr:MAG: hypothetical protein EA403_09020 [Spirochaetaceae bacterium]
MNDDILRIKISVPPLVTGVVTRRHLRDTLEQDLRQGNTFLRRMTLVSAPAGYGKTTQIRAWLSGREGSAAWYSLDAEDDEPGRFWTHLIAALQHPAPQAGIASAEAIRSNEPDSARSAGAGALLVPLLNDLFALKEPLLLVLDDYHHVEHAGIHKDMEFFIENLPGSVHVIVATRSDPPWPLSRWRAKNSIREIRLEQLRFTEEEVATLCTNRTGLTLTEPHLSILTGKTEGWIAGLQLAMHSIASHRDDIDGFISEFDGNHRHVLHFLSEEILNRQPPETERFLLQTSLLQRFCASLCDALTGRTDGERLIAELARQNLFIIALDHQGEWYRYHALFVDLLRHRLMRTDPDALPELHRRAANWYLARGLPGDAVRHARMGTDTEAVIRILEEHHDRILVTDGPGQLIRCLEDLPEHAVRRSPFLVLFTALYFLNYYGLEQAQPYLQLAEKLEFASQEEQQRISPMRSVVRSFSCIYSHQLSRAIEYAEEALRTLPPGEHIWRMRVAIYSGDARLFSGNPRQAYPFYQEAHRNALKGTNRFLPITTGLKMATTLYYLGRLKEAWETTREMLATARREGLDRIPRLGLLWALLGELHREYGELEEAERCIERGLVIGEPEKPAWGWNCLYKTALLFSRGEYDHALQTIIEIEQLDSELQLPRFVTLPAAVWKARILVALHDLSTAREELERIGVSADSPVAEGAERGALVLARLIAAEEREDPRPLLDLVQRRAAVGEDNRLLIETLLLWSSVEQSAGNRQAAQEYLEQARAIAEPAGFHQIFLDASQTPRPTTDAGRGSKHRRAAAQADLVEELSEREIEILQLVGEGSSNEQIGETLFISAGTVKWHLSNIYGKLGVSKRTRAVAVARTMAIIR